MKTSNPKQRIKEVIVYQMGKVGSTSIVASLNEAGIPAYQSHFLDTPSFHGIVDMFSQYISMEEETAHHFSEQLHNNLLLRNKLLRYQNNEMPEGERLGIISLVRNPLDWYFSHLSQNFFQVEKDLRSWLISEYQLIEDESLTKQHLHYFFAELFNCFDRIIPDMDRDHDDLPRFYFDEASNTSEGMRYRFIYGQVALLHRIHFWFDKHFTPLLDLDVMRYRFDTSNGFTVFHRGNIDIILIKFEKLGDLNIALAQFLGLPSFTMKRLNESKDKTLGKLISEARSNLPVPEHFRHKYCSSEYYETFYAEKPTGNHLLSYPQLQERRQKNHAINFTNNPVDDVSYYHEHKKKALESFLAFTNTGGLPEWPLELSLNVSSQCDISCAMCPSFSPLNIQQSPYLADGDRDMLDLESLQSIEDLLQHAIMVHLDGYGEPTQHPQFSKLLEFLAHYEVLIDFSTNGLNLTEVLCDCIVQHGIHIVNIHMSGATKEDYESIYINSEFNRVLDNIRLLSTTKKKYSSAYPIIKVNSIAFDFHLETFPLFVNIMADHGADEVTLHPLDTYDEMPQLHSRSTIMEPSKHSSLLDEAHEIARQHDIILNTEDFTDTANLPGDTPLLKAQFRHQGVNPISSKQNSLQQIRAQCLAEKEAIRASAATFGSDATAEETSGNEVPAFVKNTGIPCLEGFKTLAFSLDGRALPCTHGTNETEFGSINPGCSGQDIWHNQPLLQFRKQALIQELPSKHCAKCFTHGKHPKQHGLAKIVTQYSAWFWAMFNAPFHPALQESMIKTKTNIEILAHLNKTKKTIYLHIGSPKTEAISIQKYLSENYNHHLHTYGLLYPKAGRHCIGHHPLAADLRFKYNKDKFLDHCYGSNSRGDNWEKLIREMKEKKNDINKIVICSEDFFTLYKFHNPESIKEIRRNLSDYHVAIVVYLMRQDKLVESLFSQEIKASLQSKLSATQLISQHPTTRSNYLDMLAAWADIFGDTNIIVRPFDNNLLINSDIVSDFMHLIGVDYGAKSDGIKFNECKLTIQDLIFKSELNKRYTDKSECHNTFQKIIEKVNSTYNPRSTLLPRSDYNAIAHNSVDINKSVSDRFYDGKQLFPDFPDASSMKFIDDESIVLKAYLQNLIKIINSIELDGNNRENVLECIKHIYAARQIEI